MTSDSIFTSDPSNRSMPAATVIPVLHYSDVQAAAAWLCDAFGFTQHLLIGDHRVQLNVGAGAIVIAKIEAHTHSGGVLNHSVMVRVSNVDHHYLQAKRAGAAISALPASMPYGERQYTAIDPGGHGWTFSQTETDVDPQLWGGRLCE
jgi:uncharacterized glyoxalase superfamily protein PhnB